MLKKKIVRTFGEYKAQFISMILMIAIGIGIFVGFNMEWVTIEKNTDAFYEETHYADYRVICDNEIGFGESDLHKIEKIDGVDEAALYLSVDLNVQGEEKKSLAVTVTTNEEVSFFTLMRGLPYDPRDIGGMWLSERYAEENGISVGDEVSLQYGTTFSLTVRGLVKSAEYLICVPDNGSMMPSFENYGFCYITPKTYLLAGGTRYPQINVRTNLPEKDFKEAVNQAMGKTMLVLTKDEVVSYAEVQGEAKEGRTMGSVLPVVFLLIAVLAMITTMHRIAAKERPQIGTLKALGFRDGTIARHYTSLAFFVGALGTVFGIGIGFGIAYFIMNPNGAMGTYFDMPYWKLYMPWFAYIVMAAVLSLFTFVGYASVRKMLKGSAAETLRAQAPVKVKKTLLEKTPLWRKLPFGMKWNLRDIFRHKSRMLMSLVGVIGCMVILVGAMGMKDTADSFIEEYYEGAMNYASCITLDEQATSEAKAEIIARYQGDYSSTVPIELGDAAVSLEIWSVEHDKMRFLSEKGEYIILPTEGAYVCRRIADEYGLKAGDVVTVKPFGKSDEYRLRVKGVARSLGKSILISSAYAEMLGIDYSVGSVYTDASSSEVDKNLPAVKNVRSKTEITESFDSFMLIMNEMIALLIIAGVMLGIVVLYNLGTMGYAERYSEMATLKVMGFGDKKIAGLLIGQNMGITAIGVIFGLPLGALVLKWLIVALASEYEMSLVLGPLTYCISIFLTIGVSLFVGFLVARKNKKIDMVAALKAPE